MAASGCDGANDAGWGADDDGVRGDVASILSLLDDAHEQFDTGMAIGVFRDVAFHPLAASAPAVPSTIVLSDDSPAVISDALAAALEKTG